MLKMLVLYQIEAKQRNFLPSDSLSAVNQSFLHAYVVHTCITTVYVSSGLSPGMTSMLQDMHDMKMSCF